MIHLYQSYPEGHLTAPHGHDRPQYCYLHGGGGVISSRQQGCLLVAGQLCFLPQGQEHEFRVLRRSRLSLIYADRELGAPFGQLEVIPMVAGLFARLAQLEEAGGDGEPYLRVLGLELGRAPPLAGPQPCAAALDPRLLRVLDKVCQAPSIQPGLAELAAGCGASERTLNRLFVRQLGCTFRQWRQQVVMGRARQLQHQGLSHGRIAEILGYGDLSAFSHAFNRFLRSESVS
ncbi:helix-turn-helix domain-containing protein [Aeromonas bivalvium]|uniref:helix-turn-helix domain-containing protein n=1 Tax=Aeromonas bivalvium TaxID=440079 RepID=UPI0038D24366